MKRKRILVPLLAVCAVLLAAAGIVYAVKKSQEKTVMVISASSLNYGGGFFETSVTMDGTITADVSQDIYISGTQTVDEVFVAEGQRVYVGDKLMTYDTVKTSMNLEKEKINREQIELQIDVAMRNLVTLKKLKPVSTVVEPTEEPGEPDDYGEEEGSYPDEENPEEEVTDEVEITPTGKPKATPTPSYGKAVRYEVLDGSAEAFNASESDAGTRENPYRFLCTDGTEIRAAFIEMLRQMAEEKGRDVYFSLEIYSGDNADGKLLAAWILNAAYLDRVEDEWSRYLYLYPVVSDPLKEPTKVPENDFPFVTAAPTPIPTATPKPGEGDVDEDAPSNVGRDAVTTTPTVTSQPEPTVTDAPSGADEAGSDERQMDAPRVTSPPEGGENGAGAASYEGRGAAAGAASFEGRGAVAGTASLADRGGGYMPVLSREAVIVAASDNGYVYLANEEKSESGNAIAGALGLIPSSAKMTKEEIAERKKEEEANLTSLRLDLRECLLAIKAAENAVNEGTVLSRMNGIVRKVGDKNHISNDGSPFLSVTSEEGLYVKTYLSEKMYGKVKVGDTVDIMAWETGMSYKGRVRDISSYPAVSQYSDPLASQYPMTVSFAAGSGEVKNGEWVMVTYDPSGAGNEESMADSMGMMFLYSAFIREENGKMYVMKRGEDGLLMKQYIEIGKISGEGSEILSGVTTDDYLAFPYGKEVKEGAKTREGTIDELYTG
jgi:multidrug efflux pump subunit AcrA (membrane-fusion protein)